MDFYTNVSGNNLVRASQNFFHITLLNYFKQMKSLCPNLFLLVVRIVVKGSVIVSTRLKLMILTINLLSHREEMSDIAFETVPKPFRCDFIFYCLYCTGKISSKL